MNRITAAARRFFDVRPGEYRQTIFMCLYLFFVLGSYYILKSASESLFLNKNKIDKLSFLYILISVFGAALAYAYSKVAARTSLWTAVTVTMFVSFACLLAMWFPLRNHNSQAIWVFAVWVRLYSVLAVTQGWVVATNLFDARQAKRLYGLLCLGMVLGAMFGGEYTRAKAKAIGTNNLLLRAAPMVLIAYVCFAIAAWGRVTRRVKAEGREQRADFTFRDIAQDVAQSRHVQALITIMALQYTVDTWIDWQFKASVKAVYQGDAMTAFIGHFQGLYLNTAEVLLQVLLTSFVIRRTGLGNTLQIMPVSLAAASVFTFASPVLLWACAAKLTEASTRYTLVRTATELFYMPLSLDLRNRIKAFIDVFVDRAARGIAAVPLIFFERSRFGVRGVALATIVITIPWVLLNIRAHREYVRTIRQRVQTRRLDFEPLRVSVEDADTISVLERTARSSNARQATYALSLLNEAPGYDLEPLLLDVATSSAEEVRAKAYDLARAGGIKGLTERARAEVAGDGGPDVLRGAAAYLLAVSKNPRCLAVEWLSGNNPALQEGVMEALAATPQEAAEIATHDWISANGGHADWRNRALAARMAGLRGDEGTAIIHNLLRDPDPRVASAACRAAATLRNRDYVLEIASLLAGYRTRGAAVDALADYGAVVCGTLADMLDDDRVSVSIRANIPRVLKRIRHQRSVDVLASAHRHAHAAVRTAALDALVQLRESAPRLNYTDPLVKQEILNEAHHYCELIACFEPLRKYADKRRSAVGLLARTIDERMRHCIRNLFRLLALQYSTDEMHSTYLAVSHADRAKRIAAMEFLDTVLDQDLKRILVPLLESDGVPTAAMALFGVSPYDAATAIKALLESDDPWVVSCAVAAVAELGLRELAGAASDATRRSGASTKQLAAST